MCTCAEIMGGEGGLEKRNSSGGGVRGGGGIMFCRTGTKREEKTSSEERLSEIRKGELALAFLPGWGVKGEEGNFAPSDKVSHQTGISVRSKVIEGESEARKGKSFGRSRLPYLRLLGRPRSKGVIGSAGSGSVKEENCTMERGGGASRHEKKGGNRAKLLPGHEFCRGLKNISSGAGAEKLNEKEESVV